jgi:hypothetical protein
MAQWAAAAGAALQRGATSVHADEAVRAAQEKATAEAKAAKKQEAEAAMVGEASVAKIEEATMANTNEAEAVKAFKEAALADAGKMAAEATSASPRTEDQPGGRGGEREVHTISSGKPPRPHGKGVVDAEVSSTVEMVVPGAPKGPKVKETLALVRIETDPWAVPTPVFVGDYDEEEEAHWVVLGGFDNLVERSLRMALHILTKDLPHAVEVNPSLFS